MRRSVVALVAAGAAVLTGCSAPQPPEVTFYTDGESVTAGPMSYCDALLTDCQVTDGDPVVLTHPYGTTAGVLRADDRVRPGVVSLTHGWIGTNPTALTSTVDDVDPLTGMICQSAIPVTLARAPA